MKRRQSSRFLLPLLAVAGLDLPSASVLAELEPPEARRRVVLLVDTPGDPFMSRIGAEVGSLGLEVVVRAPQGSIENSARSEHAVAAIRMLPSRKGVEVWMADETSGRSLLRQAIVDETAGGPNQNLIALQTAELLRTSFLPHRPAEAAAPPLAPPAPAPAPAIAERAPPPSSAESGVMSSVGVLYAAGGASAAWQVSVAYQHLWNDQLGIALHVSAPLLRGTMSGPEGTAEVGAITAGGEALSRFKSAGGRLFVTTALGAALVAVLANGHPNQTVSGQLLGTSSTAYTGLGYARLTLGWQLAHWLSVGLSGLAGSTVARVHVRFAGNDAGDWGVPVLGAGLFAQVDWR